MDIILSDEQIKQLIQAPKRITQPPTKEDKVEGQYYRNQMWLTSANGQYGFKAYFRRHVIFQENFSIGLVYEPIELKQSVTLFRCNGPHGPTKLWDHHESPHVHQLTEEDLRQDRKTESDITVTKAYSTYEEAVVYFVKTCGIDDSCDYIKKMKQLNLDWQCTRKNS